MKLTVITTIKTFEFVLSKTSSIDKVNQQIINEIMDNSPYVMFDYPFYYNQGFVVTHPIPIHKQHLISWYITEE